MKKLHPSKKKWKTVFPATGFDHWFLNDEFNRMYVSEERVSDLAKAFAVLAIIITILGVFGLASYTAEQRTKEIGIRKVLGASEKQVAGLFLNVFLKIIAISFLLAIPIAWFAAYKWLQNFVYRTSIDPLLFGISLMVLLAITLLTVGFEILKSIKVSPVKSLRTE